MFVSRLIEPSRSSGSTSLPRFERSLLGSILPMGDSYSTDIAALEEKGA